MYYNDCIVLCGATDGSVGACTVVCKREQNKKKRERQKNHKTRTMSHCLILNLPRKEKLIRSENETVPIAATGCGLREE